MIFCTGGAEYRIEVLGRCYFFEDNPRIGPWPLTGGQPWKRPHRKFLVAASLWAQQGKRTRQSFLAGVREAVWTPPDEKTWRRYMNENMEAVYEQGARMTKDEITLNDPKLGKVIAKSKGGE